MDSIQEKIEEIVALLYQEKQEEAYEKLSLIIPVLANEIESIQEVEKQKELVEILESALSAMEEEDLTLLADVLQYDLIEHLK